MCFTASKLTLFFRCDKYSSPNHAFTVRERIILCDVEVLQVCVPNPESILVPVVTECFQVAIVVVSVTNLEMHDHPFLFSVDFSHRFLVLPGKDTEMLQRLKIIC